MTLLPPGLPCALDPRNTLGLGGLAHATTIARGRLGRVAAVGGKSVFEIVDPLGKSRDHLSLLVDLSEEVLDEIDDGVGALFINR
jgi:hypothetical protein